jgi:protein TonB
MVTLHALAIHGLMRLAPTRPSLGAPAPIFAELVVPPAPEPPQVAPPPPPPPARAVVPPLQRAVIAAKKTVRRVERTVVTPPEPPQPEKLAEEAPAPIEAAPAASAAEPTPQPSVAAAAPPPAPAPNPAPKDISIRAVEYLAFPVLRYPTASRRLLEEGRVDVRVLVDARGAPRETVIVRSSGYPRLDEAALATVRATRFRPYTENGVAMPFWVVMPLIFELES